MALAKRILIGTPIATSDEGHQRLPKRVALPVFASDAISSTAYATDEILVVLLIQAGIGAAAWDQLVPLAIVVAILLVIVVASYRQTIYAYPSGGGSYVVSRENLGRTPALVAGASLLTDYILTVAVSIAGGVLAIQSAFGFDSRWRVPLCLALIAVMTIANLRGLKESGAVFAPPTYLYIGMLMLLIGVGFYRIFVQHVGPIPLEDLSVEAQELAHGTQALSVLLLLRAFSSGAVALSGVEAVSNGVPAFRRAREPQRGDDDRHHGRRPRHLLPRRVDPRLPPPALPRRERPDRDRPHGRVHLRRQRRAVLGDTARHVRHPDPRRQHRLRRLPPPVIDHRPRRLPATTVGQPW